MRSVTELRVQPCPECGAEIRADRRFVAWCTACDWNVDPAGPDEKPRKLERLRRSLARRHGERLLSEVSAGGALLPRRDVAGALAYVIALAVHASTVALVVGGALLVILGWGSALPVLGRLSCCRRGSYGPASGRLPDDGPVLHRTGHPNCSP